MMSRTAWTVARVLACGVLWLGVGCTEPEEPAVTIHDPNADRIADLEGQLQQARGMAAASQDEIVRLQNELNRLREQLAQRQEPPSPAPGWDSVPGGAMTSIEGTVLFDSGKAVIKSSARRTLEEVAAIIREKFPDSDVYVFGHTDDQPIRHSPWKDNYELSCQRALSVVRFLESSGVGQNMAACGWGDRRPVAAGSTASARQANRRVEIFAMLPQRALSGASESSPPTHE